MPHPFIKPASDCAHCPGTWQPCPVTTAEDAGIWSSYVERLEEIPAHFRAQVCDMNSNQGSLQRSSYLQDMAGTG